MNSTDFRRKCRDELVEYFNRPDGNHGREGYIFRAKVFDEQGCESRVGFSADEIEDGRASAARMNESEIRDMVCNEGIPGAAIKIADKCVDTILESRTHDRPRTMNARYIRKSTVEADRKRHMLAQIIGRPLPPDFFGSVQVNLKQGRPLTADVKQSVIIEHQPGEPQMP